MKHCVYAVRDVNNKFNLNIYEILNISEKFDDLNNMETTSSESKEKLERSGKVLVTALAFKTKVRSTKYKRLSSEMSVRRTFLRLLGSLRNLIKLPYKKKRPKHEPTDSYFHLTIQLAKCMMRSDNLNWYNHGGYTDLIIHFAIYLAR